MSSGRTMRIGEAVLGGSLFALAMLIAIDTMLTPSAGRGVVGPALFPYLISGGLALVAIALLREAWSGHAPHGSGLELDVPAVLLVAGGLAAQFLLIEVIGWIPAAAMLFAAVARAFGNRRTVLNLLLGLLLAGLTFAVFTYGLDLNLPIGSLAEQLTPSE